MSSILIAVIIIVIIMALCTKKPCHICEKKGGAANDFPRNFAFIAPQHRPFRATTFNRYCISCEGKVKDAERAILQAQNHEPLATWSSNYKGHIPVIAGTERDRIRTEEFRDKSDAERQLLITAAFAYPECNAVKDISFGKGTGSEGNYKFTVWAASGIPCQADARKS